MKNLFYSLFLAVFVFASCSKEEENPNYLSVDGTKYQLSVGTIDDNGTDPNDLTYRRYALLLTDKETNPSTYIKFELYSPSTTRLQEGTYTYDYNGYEKDKFSYIKFAHNLVYDSKNVITGGKSYKEIDYVITGTIVVGKSGSHYTFDVNFTATEKTTSPKTYTVKAYFEDSLTEDYVSLYKK